MALSVVTSADNNASSASCAVTINGVTAGDGLAIYVTSILALTGISGNSNTYTSKASYSANGGFENVYLVANANAGNTTITVTTATANFIELVVYQLHDSLSSGKWAYDTITENNPTTGTTTAITTNSLTNKATNEILIGYAFPNNGDVSSGESGWNYVTTAGGGGREYIVLTSAGQSNAATFTNNEATGGYNAFVAGFYTTIYRPGFTSSSVSSANVPPVYAYRPVPAPRSVSSGSISSQYVYRPVPSPSSVSSAAISPQYVYRSLFDASSVSGASITPQYLYRPKPSPVSTSGASISPQYVYRSLFVANSNSSATISPQYVYRPQLLALSTSSGAIAPQYVYRSSFNANSTSKATISPQYVYRPKPSPVSISSGAISTQYLFRPTFVAVSGSSGEMHAEFPGGAYRPGLVANSISSAVFNVRYVYRPDLIAESFSSATVSPQYVFRPRLTASSSSATGLTFQKVYRPNLDAATLSSANVVPQYLYRPKPSALSISEETIQARPVYRPSFTALSESSANISIESLYRPIPVMASNSSAVFQVEYSGGALQIVVLPAIGSTVTLPAPEIKRGNVSLLTQIVNYWEAEPLMNTAAAIRNINFIPVFGIQGTYTNFGFVVPKPIDAGLFIAPGEPNDVSGWTITFRVKGQASDPDSAAIVLHTFTIQDGTDGVIQDGVSAELNATLPTQNYFWSMTASIGGGPSQPLFSGVYTLSAAPTAR